MSTPITVGDATIRDFHNQLYLAGLRPEYAERGPASGLLAVRNGMPVAAILDCLLRNRSEMFSARLARKRLRNV